jgi:DNA ligase (NAD+)
MSEFGLSDRQKEQLIGRLLAEKDDLTAELNEANRQLSAALQGVKDGELQRVKIADLTAELQRAQAENERLEITISGNDRSAWISRLTWQQAYEVAAGTELARSLPMSRVFCSLGVTMTGRSMSRRLATSFTTMRALRDASTERLQAVEAVGPERAASILSEMSLLKDDLDYLEAHDIGQSEPVRGGTAGAVLPLSGQTWVVTGSMTGALSGKSRNEVHEFLESLGAKTSGSVSKTTTVLLVGEKADAKAEKAASLGVTVLTEADFAAQHPLS